MSCFKILPAVVKPTNQILQPMYNKQVYIADMEERQWDSDYWSHKHKNHPVKCPMQADP